MVRYGRSVAYAATAFAIVVLFMMILLYANPSGVSRSDFIWLEDFFIFLVSAAAALASFVLLKQKFDGYDSWKLIFSGLVLWSIGEFVWFFYEGVLGVIDPWPSIADVFWVAGYLPFTAALMMHIKKVKAAKIFKDFSVALVGAVGSGLVIRYVLGASVFPADQSGFESILAMAYPIGDLFLIIMSLILLEAALNQARQSTTRAATWACLAGGFLLFAVFDFYFSYLVANEQTLVGDFSNIVYVVAYVLVVLASSIVLLSKNKAIHYPHEYRG